MTTENLTPNGKFKEQLRELHAIKEVPEDESVDLSSENVEPQTTEKDNGVQGRDEQRGRKESTNSANELSADRSLDTERDEQATKDRRQVKSKKIKDGDEEEKPYIPSFILKQEKEARKKAEAELAEYKKRLETAEILKNILPQTPQAPAQVADEDVEPVYEQEPDRWYLWRDKQREKEIAELRNQLNQGREQETTRSQLQYLDNSINTSINQIKQTKPDFDDAYGHLLQRAARMNMLTGMSEEQNKQALQMATIQMAAKAMQMNITPAEFFYEMAVAGGYEPKKARSNSQKAISGRSLSELNENIKRNVSLSGSSGDTDGGEEEEELSNIMKPVKNIDAFLGRNKRDNVEKWRETIRKTK